MAQQSDEEGTKRVRDNLDFTLKPVLAHFVEANMKAKHGPRWLQFASRAGGMGSNDPLDVYGLLKTILDNWSEVFSACFERKNNHKARRLISQLFDARNATAHLDMPLSDAECLNHLHAMQETAGLLKASGEVIGKLKKAYDGQRGTSAVAEPVAAIPVELPFEDDGARVNLKPWVDVALPHPDVISNRFKQSEFAADLFAVDSGNAGESYATPPAFFGMTFLTEGLKRVLVTAAQRLSGVGGDPVIGLQTAFGGGKTHTMLALYHLAKHLHDNGDVAVLPGLGDALATAGAGKMPKPKLAVFVGSSQGPDVSLRLKDGPVVHTLWGYIAWRVAGDAGLKIVAEAEQARTNPGSERMVEVFKLAGPSVILLDEVVLYARQLDDARFEAFLSFMQSLTEAAKMAPGILIVGSLPESDLEAGGDRGKDALRRLEKVFGRVQSPWLPASGDETYEIIRRRLFQPLDSDGVKARDETVKAFHDLYRKNASEFPPEAKEARYLELLRLSYPIHPELFDRLSKDWASLPNFQRTRGVLRFMANVIGVLWHSQVRDPMITPARIPVSHERVRASVLYPLDPAFGAVVDREVDGDSSLAQRMEANPQRRLSQARAATRVARSVFMCSAPLVGQPNAGVTGQGLRLACAEPGDQLAIFGEALRELTERATYLYEEAGRYWFSTQPTLNRLADDRAKAFPDYEVDAEIVKILGEDTRIKGGFDRVFTAPDDPTSVEESSAMSLVVLGPAFFHAGKGAGKSPATDAANDTLLRRGSSQRRYRNALLFVAPDDTQLSNARDVTRKAMAWASISNDKRLQEGMTQSQGKDAGEKAKSNKDAALRAVRNAWNHILFPEKSETAGKPFELSHVLISARERSAIPSVVFDRAIADSHIREKLGGETFWLELKDIWPADRPHLPVSEVAEWFSTYPYLKKLRDRIVMDAAIRDAVGKLDPQFGYAEGFDAATGKYHKLHWAKRPPEFFGEGSLLVRGAEARTQADQENLPKPTVVAGIPIATVSGEQPSGSPTQTIPPQKPKRFYGSVEIDIARPVKSFDAIINAVVMELQRAAGTKVTLTLEIAAENQTGFADGDVSVVRDNAKQLKFKAESTGFEE